MPSEYSVRNVEIAALFAEPIVDDPERPLGAGALAEMRRCERIAAVVLTEYLRPLVYARNQFTCCWCNKRQSELGVELSVDHIRPRSNGGATTMDNLQTLCRRCNSKKGART